MPKATWENNGEANEEGKFIAVVDVEDGTRPQRFVGDSYREVADQLLQAQQHATEKIRTQSARIRELDKPDTGPGKPRLAPRALSADERFKVAADIGDPQRAPEAIKTVVEAELGAPMAQIREQLNNNIDDGEAAQAAADATQFIEETPEFYQSAFNKSKLVRYMQSMGMSPTLKNFHIAYTDLTEAGLLQVKPDTPPPQPQPGVSDSAPGTRPRPITTMSTGIRSSDSSGAPDMRRATQPKLTRAQVESMPEAEYRRRYQSEPGFREIVDKLYASQAQA